MFPQSALCALIIYPDGSSTTSTFGGEITNTGIKYNGSFLGADNRVYSAARRANHFLQVDLNTTTATKVTFGLTVSPTTTNYTHGNSALAKNGKIYMFRVESF